VPDVKHEDSAALGPEEDAILAEYQLADLVMKVPAFGSERATRRVVTERPECALELAKPAISLLCVPSRNPVVGLDRLLLRSLRNRDAPHASQGLGARSAVARNPTLLADAIDGLFEWLEASGLHIFEPVSNAFESMNTSAICAQNVASDG
jgi:hypothetical protein